MPHKDSENQTAKSRMWMVWVVGGVILVGIFYWLQTKLESIQPATLKDVPGVVRQPIERAKEETALKVPAKQPNSEKKE